MVYVGGRVVKFIYFFLQILYGVAFVFGEGAYLLFLVGLYLTQGFVARAMRFGCRGKPVSYLHWVLFLLTLRILTNLAKMIRRKLIPVLLKVIKVVGLVNLLLLVRHHPDNFFNLVLY
jgi:hypothetical protein